MLMIMLASFLVALDPMLQTTGGDPNKNLSFLFAGFVVVWVLLLGYIFSVMRRQKRLEAEIEMLKEMRQEKKP